MENDAKRKEQMDNNMPKPAKDATYSLPKSPSKGDYNERIGKQIVPKD